jgi:hypothetical protein
MRGFEPAYALEVSTRFQVEHFNGVVYLGRDEEMIPLEIHREVIKVPGNFRKVRGAQKCDGRLRPSSLRAGMNAKENDDREKQAGALFEKMRWHAKCPINGMFLVVVDVSKHCELTQRGLEVKS